MKEIPGKFKCNFLFLTSAKVWTKLCLLVDALKCFQVFVVYFCSSPSLTYVIK